MYRARTEAASVTARSSAAASAGTGSDRQYRAAHIATGARVMLDVRTDDDWRLVSVQFVRAQARLETVVRSIAAIVGNSVLPDRRPWIASELIDGARLGDVLAKKKLVVAGRRGSSASRRSSRSPTTTRHRARQSATVADRARDRCRPPVPDLPRRGRRCARPAFRRSAIRRRPACTSRPEHLNAARSTAAPMSTLGAIAYRGDRRVPRRRSRAARRRRPRRRDARSRSGLPTDRGRRQRRAISVRRPARSRRRAQRSARAVDAAASTPLSPPAVAKGTQASLGC